MRDLLGFVLPAIVSCSCWWLISSIRPGPQGKVWAGAAGSACGFFAGFAWFESAQLFPSTYWHWLPWLGLLTLLGPIESTVARSFGIQRAWLLWLSVAVASAWMLVPTWPDLSPARGWYVAIFAAGVWFLSISLKPLSRRAAGHALLPSMCVSTLAGAGLLATTFSLRFGMLAAVAASALTGVWLASQRDVFTRGTSCPADCGNPTAGGTHLFYAVVFGGLMLVGELAAVVPSLCFVLLLAAPLALWPGELPVGARRTGRSARIIRMIAVLLPIITAVLLAIFVERQALSEK